MGWLCFHPQGWGKPHHVQARYWRGVFADFVVFPNKARRVSMLTLSCVRYSPIECLRLLHALLCPQRLLGQEGAPSCCYYQRSASLTTSHSKTCAWSLPAVPGPLSLAFSPLLPPLPTLIPVHPSSSHHSAGLPVFPAHSLGRKRLARMAAKPAPLALQGPPLAFCCHSVPLPRRWCARPNRHEGSGGQRRIA